MLDTLTSMFATKDLILQNPVAKDGLQHHFNYLYSPLSARGSGETKRYSTLIPGLSNGFDNNVEHVEPWGSLVENRTDGTDHVWDYNCSGILETEIAYDYRDQQAHPEKYSQGTWVTSPAADRQVGQWPDGIPIFWRCPATMQYRQSNFWADAWWEVYDTSAEFIRAYEDPYKRYCAEIRIVYRRRFFRNNGDKLTYWTYDFYRPIDLSKVTKIEGTMKEVSKTALYEDCIRIIPPVNNAAKYQAFKSACGGIEHMDTNNLANVGMVIDMIKALLNKDIKGALQIPTKLEDLWLWYRYSYCTTKSDIKELAKFQNVISTILDKKGSYGTFLYNGIFYRCSLVVEPASNSWDRIISDALYNLGLAPTLNNIWDMIPFSFIVDWFASVGDVLETVDCALRYNDSYWNFDRIVYSVSMFVESAAYSGISYEYYRRWWETSPPPLTGWVGDYDPSTDTVIKRTIDTGSLIISSRR